MSLIAPNAILVPVPLHHLRLWRRGYNQAGLLVQEIAKITGTIPAVDALRRRKSTPPLGGLGKKARVRALSGAIEVRRGWAGRLDGADIVLVDDVLTSGATTNACVNALKQAGAKTVRIACFARVVEELAQEPT
ncbi:ComF family protein [Croceicoccus estronivorus]|uniref:ComF family protein n=1 Tax=Croceicoccus estronivorus TaxID=1172626 RepID=UPI002E26819D|nr:phosphoribosyltransferase family protein [Croceicoccus estronivorus]